MDLLLDIYLVFVLREPLNASKATAAAASEELLTSASPRKVFFSSQCVTEEALATLEQGLRSTLVCLQERTQN